MLVNENVDMMLFAVIQILTILKSESFTPSIHLQTHSTINQFNCNEVFIWNPKIYYLTFYNFSDLYILITIILLGVHGYLLRLWKVVKMEIEHLVKSSNNWKVFESVFLSTPQVSL